MRLGVEAPRGHIMHHRYSLTGCPFGVLIMVILSPFSSSPRLISGIPVTGFRLRFLVPGLPSEARGHHSGGMDTFVGKKKNHQQVDAASGVRHPSPSPNWLVLYCCVHYRVQLLQGRPGGPFWGPPDIFYTFPQVN